MEIVGLLLAAGSGSRFGGDKLSQRLADGRPMAVAAAEALLPACDRLLAVLRPGAETLAGHLGTAGCQIVFCAEAAYGMGHSLAGGVQASAAAAGWLVALADMPFVTAESCRRVAVALRDGASIAVPCHSGRYGHPVGFSSTWYSDLAALSGDRGARHLLDKAGEALVVLDLPDPGIVRDIDRREDWFQAPGPVAR